jgi:hypothetical protein
MWICKLTSTAQPAGGIGKAPGSPALKTGFTDKLYTSGNGSATVKSKINQ